MTVDRVVKAVISRSIGTPIDSGLERGIPPDIWVDPAVDDKRIMNGANVQTLQKIEGSLVDFTRITAGEQPLYTAGAINNLGVIESQSVERQLRSVNTVSSSQISFVAQFVWRRTLDLGGYIFTTGFTDLNAYILDFTGGKFRCRSFRVGVGFIGEFSSASSFPALNVAAVVTVVYDAPNNLLTLRINGIHEGSTSTVLTISTTEYNIILLNHWGVANFSITGQQMGAFMSNWGILPSLEQIKTRERYLMNRYL